MGYIEGILDGTINGIDIEEFESELLHIWQLKKEWLTAKSSRQLEIDEELNHEYRMHFEGFLEAVRFEIPDLDEKMQKLADIENS